MQADVVPTTQGPSREIARRTGDRRGPSRRRWWKRGLLLIAVVAVVVPAAVLIPRVTRSRELRPRLTYTVTRGDLVVSVTENGTLDSSENVEIKCKVRGANIPILWVVESGTEVKPGDELVRLETLEFEDRVNEVLKWAHVTRSVAERSKADLAKAELALKAYLAGTYDAQLLTLEKELAIAESSLSTARSMLNHAEKMAERGYVGELEVEEKGIAVTQAELNLAARKTDIDLLKNFTKKMELETLNGNLKATTARHEADKERAKQLAEQLILCEGDLAYCSVKAESSGLVIHPAAEPWKWTPEIEVGATVYMGQTMLLMPDLSKMQVKVGIPEAVVHRIKPGLDTKIILQNQTLESPVFSVAAVSAPTSRWTGSIVTYDTVIRLPSQKGLKPGMSAEVEVIIARYDDVLTIPVAAIVETAGGNFCWVDTAGGPQRRRLELGDTNDVHMVVTGGVEEGDEVFLNPLAFERTGTEEPKPQRVDGQRVAQPTVRCDRIHAVRGLSALGKWDPMNRVTTSFCK